MAKTSDARNGNTVKHVSVLNKVLCDCRDIHNKKFQGSIYIRFILAIEFVCDSCKSTVIVKIESTQEQIICPICRGCQFTMTDTFNKILEDAKRPTPNRIRSRRISNRQTTNRAGRPPLDRITREPTQLTLHPDTIDVLHELNVSRGELFEFLLNFFPPFTSILKKKRQE